MNNNKKYTSPAIEVVTIEIEASVLSASNLGDLQQTNNVGIDEITVSDSPFQF